LSQGKKKALLAPQGSEEAYIGKDEILERLSDLQKKRGRKKGENASSLHVVRGKRAQLWGKSGSRWGHTKGEGKPGIKKKKIFIGLKRGRSQKVKVHLG